MTSVRQQPHCLCGCVHRAAELAIAGDERAGLAVRVALVGQPGHQFVELAVDRFSEPPDTEPEPHTQPEPHPGSTTEAPHALTVMQHPDDPLYVTDPHAHDVTLAQAAELHRALGELLALTRPAMPATPANSPARTDTGVLLRRTPQPSSAE